MTDHIVGKKIINFRKRTGMSQGELGKLLNVSAQAVSRWEHGGMPDATLLPKVAEMLGCSLDDLYAISSAPTKSIEELLAQELRDTPQELRMQRSLELAWHIMKLNGSNVVGDGSDIIFASATACEDSDLGEPVMPGGYPTSCYFDYENGLTYASVSSKFKYVLFMQEPEEGYTSIMNSADDYQKLFSLFSKKHRLAVYLLGFSLPQGKQFTRDYVCTQLNLTQEQAQEILDELCKHCMLNYSSIQASGHCVDTYSVPKCPPIIPFLYFAKALMRDGKTYSLCVNERNTPLFRSQLPTTSQPSAWTPINSKDISKYMPLIRAKDNTV